MRHSTVHLGTGVDTQEWSKFCLQKRILDGKVELCQKKFLCVTLRSLDFIVH